MEKQTVLVADDEELIVKLICDFLNNAGFKTLCAYDGAQALDLFASNDDISLCIIDIMMPEMDGWQLTREIRKSSLVPIIMLSARGEEFDQLLGFEAGIDEYVTKPFSPAVLVKRVEALLKRGGMPNNQNSNESGLVVSKESYTASLDGKPISLTLKEFELLSLLFENAGRVLSREQLLDSIWGYDYLGDTRTVDSHIARLRVKLGDYGAARLKTVYGMGYKLEIV